MGQSHKLALTNRTAANDALLLRFEGKKSELASDRRMSRTTVTDFFNGKPIGEKSFRKICMGLGLNWKDVSVEASSPIPVANNLVISHEGKSLPKIEVFVFRYKLELYIQANEQQIAVFIEKVQNRCRQKILKQHSQMRLLSGDEIGVDQLYVDVWLLKTPEHKRFDTSESLLNQFDFAKDRLALGRRIRRNPGFEIANSNPKLIILGKPGSGKTTFLKHLAVDWYKGQFQPQNIAVLIELRQIREEKWNLVHAIGQELDLNKNEILDLLEQGRLLLLMDGLDEVPTDKLRRNVQAQVKQVSEEFSNKNRIILTCRTQIIGTIPSGFTSVEVADFNPEQVRQFVQNWFTANGQSEADARSQWEKVYRVTTDQPDLNELTATPVLLSLFCVVLQDSGEIPTNRANLYSKGINWLLRRWNSEKEIEGWEVGNETYRQLSIKDKESLLTEIAAHKFENPKNFVLFEQGELVGQISQNLQLANEQEGLAVLKAIEAQHGLLIERADELWSFSHLTFQEYFTVQWLTHLPPQQLAEKIASQQWQKVVEQIVKSQQPANRLLRLIKQAIDQSMTQEPVIQTFLDWLLQKSASLQTSYKPAAIRAFYYSLTSDSTHTLDQSLNLHLSLDLVLSIAHDHDLHLSLARALDLDRALYLSLEHTRKLSLGNVHDLYRSLDRALNLDGSPDLISRLHQLKVELPKSNRPQEIQRWWLLHGTLWTEQLQQVMIDYRNIGHDWQFTQEQQQKLQRYFETNKFLVDLMKIDGAASEECCTEIEESLLLPLAELQRLQPHLY